MRIYLDHNATTPVRPEVADAMLAALRDGFGNPSSAHTEGNAARRSVERAREQVAALVGADAPEICFVSGASEANNAVLWGILADAGPRHVVTTTVEHPSLEEPLRALAQRGAQVTRVAVDARGVAEPAAFARALRADTALVSVILANNETGVLQDGAAIAGVARARGVSVHFDATQAIGKLPLDLPSLGADFASGTAHKLNGPKGTGFLWTRAGRELAPFVRGGPQERQRRGGTENVAGIVGLGVACELARRELEPRRLHVARLRDELWLGIHKSVPRVTRNGAEGAVLPNTLSVEFEGVAGELLVEALDLEGVAVSAGAACHAGQVEPSRILLAMGRSAAQARASLRFSLGPSNTASELARVLALLPPLVARVREAGV